MRVLLLLIFSLPFTCNGIGLDSCELEGKINSKKVTLNWVYLNKEKVEGFGLEGSPIYGFCTMGAKGEHNYFMSCAATNGGKETVYYETPTNNNSMYVCKTGCEENAVKKFVMKCVGD